MWKQIDLQEVNQHDRYAPDAEYTIRKAACAEAQRPFVYRVEGNVLHIDTSKAPLSIEQIKERLRWGCQWNSWEV